MFKVPCTWIEMPKERTKHGTGIEAGKAAQYRAEIDPAAKALLEECLANPRDRRLVSVANLNTLRRLVEERTQLECKRCQYRDQAGLVEFLMQWFPTREKLLEAVALAINSRELPPDFGRASSLDPFLADFDTLDNSGGALR